MKSMMPREAWGQANQGHRDDAEEYLQEWLNMPPAGCEFGARTPRGAIQGHTVTDPDNA